MNGWARWPNSSRWPAAIGCASKPPLAGELRAGDSVAVAGVCLTALVADHAELHADVGPETARVTTLGGLARGQRVNLERPLPADGRLGGHFVLGHVDGSGWSTTCGPKAAATG